MRGYFRLTLAVRRPDALFPAYAGVFPASAGRVERLGPLPRLCGGISASKALPVAFKPSSPPMRGYFFAPADSVPCVFLFPAYAGVFPSASTISRLRTPLPRLCGGISRHLPDPADSRSSSPPMRGYFHPAPNPSHRPPLFPAYAGVFLRSCALCL